MFDQIIEKKIVAKFKEYIRLIQEHNNSNNNSVYNYNSYCDELEDYIIYLLYKGPFKTTNGKIICKYIPELINYTPDHSWLTSHNLTRNEEYVEKIYEGILNINNKNNIMEILHEIYEVVIRNEKIREKLYSKEIIDFILDKKLSEESYDDFYMHLDEEKQKYFIDKSIEKQIPIHFLISRLEVNNKKYIKSRAMDIIKYSNSFYVKRNLCYNNPEVLNKVNDYLNNNPEIVFKSIKEELNSFLERTILSLEELDKNGKKIDTNDILDVIEKIITEIIKYDDTPISSIDYSFGSYSFVLITNSKVIKLGCDRENDFFPDNPYIVKPLIRRKLESNGSKFFLEVTERVETLNNSGIGEEEVYGLYKNMRDLGLIWTDAEVKNVGRLLKDNIIHWGKELSDESVNQSFDGKRGNIVLKKGDLVVLDADYIYKVGDKNIVYPRGSKAYDFEERYLEEKKKELEKKDSKIKL